MLYLGLVVNANRNVVRRIFCRAASFKVLNAKLDCEQSVLQLAEQRASLANYILEDVLMKAQNAGGSKAIHRHTLVNKKLLVRERLKLLFDEGTPFLEIGALAGYNMDYGNVTGSVAGIGKVHNRFCMVMANDATVKGGTLFPITVEKQIRIQHLSLLNRLPCIYLVDSGGAFLPLQADIFPDRNHGGRVFYNETVLTSKGIPQLALVCGSCTAGGAYCPMMAEEAIIVNKMGIIFLGGPPLVKAATGEIVSEQELGGADLHCSVSGCTDHYAETEEEAFEQCRESVLCLNLSEQISSETYDKPLYSSKELDVISGKPTLQKDDLYKVIARLTDGSTFKEFKTRFGSNLVTGFSFLCGRLIGIVSNCGYLTWQDAQKGTHFIQLCDQRNIPLVFLQNSGDAHNGDDSLDGLVLKERAKMTAAHCTARVPKICVNIGGCSGDENFTMCGPQFEANFVLSWPLAQVSTEWLPTDKRCSVLDNCTEEKQYDNVFDKETSAFYRASRMLIDGIIQPSKTREILALCLDIAISQTAHPLRDSKQSVMRM